MYIHIFNRRHNAGNAFFTSIQCSSFCQYKIKGLISTGMKMVAVQQRRELKADIRPSCKKKKKNRVSLAASLQLGRLVGPDMGPFFSSVPQGVTRSTKFTTSLALK